MYQMLCTVLVDQQIKMVWLQLGLPKSVSGSRGPHPLHRLTKHAMLPANHK